MQLASIQLTPFIIFQSVFCFFAIFVYPILFAYLGFSLNSHSNSYSLITIGFLQSNIGILIVLFWLDIFKQNERNTPLFWGYLLIVTGFIIHGWVHMIIGLKKRE